MRAHASVLGAGVECSLSSLPLVPESALKQEVKWVGHPDSVYELYTFEYMVKRYATHVVFLRYVGYWMDRVLAPERTVMCQFVRRLRMVHNPILPNLFLKQIFSI